MPRTKPVAAVIREGVFVDQSAESVAAVGRS
jgi:hypothetical protein